VFNALVLFCIRDIFVALQKMLKLKPEKDQKKYELDVAFVPLLFSLNVAVERWFSSHFCFFCSVLRLVVPSASPKWQKNQIDVKMYLSGVVQVCFAPRFKCLQCPSCLLYYWEVGGMRCIRELFFFDTEQSIYNKAVRAMVHPKNIPVSTSVSL